jgi:hypothetical protein
MPNIDMEFGSVQPRTIFAGTEIPALTTSITIASGEGKLDVGALIGVVEADGKGKLVDKEATDGSKVAKYVLAEPVDATSADVVALVWKTGIFNYDILAVAEGDTVENHADELREVGIHYRKDY